MLIVVEWCNSRSRIAVAKNRIAKTNPSRA
jgi:hypothetical protein